MSRMMIVAALLAVALVGTAAGRGAGSLGPRWHELEGYSFADYVRDFGRTYNGAEYAQRRAVFEARLAAVRAHNAEPAHTWKRGVNHFSDMTGEEWRAYNRGGRRAQQKMKAAGAASLRVVGSSAATAVVAPQPQQASMQLPTDIDYRTWTSPRVLTSVRDQGGCGNCWAHSSTETIESQFALQTGKLLTLSVQQITSCTPFALGCDGGMATVAYDFLNISATGLTQEWAYPFTDYFFDYNNASAPTAACYDVRSRTPKDAPHLRPSAFIGVTGYTSVTPNNAVAAQQALLTSGPQSISVAAGNWQDYESGVLQNTNASGPAAEWNVDHDVQLVGYGFDAVLNVPYWIVRNSWSAMWGEEGFIRLWRAPKPADEPCSPQSYGPVCGTSGCLNDPHFPQVYLRGQ